ncbi:MAG: arylesterase [Alphaproteobacteria bacterium]|nr:arylesterase [Alphaproteobacteria bacterium]
MRIVFKTIVVALLVASPVAAQAAGRPIRILAFGDSLTQGYGVPPGDDFPDVLEHALKAKGLNVSVINAGVSGDTSAGGLARLDWSLEDANNPPDAAILELGANDGLRGLPVDDMAKNLDTILARFKARGIPVLLAGMKAPRNYGDSYAKQFDAVYPQLARKYGVLLYPFFLDGVALNTNLIQADGLHPNPAGVEVIVRNMTPMVVRLIEQAKEKQAS